MLTLARFARCIALATGLLAVAIEMTPAQSLSYVGALQYATGDFIFTQRIGERLLLQRSRLVGGPTARVGERAAGNAALWLAPVQRGRIDGTHGRMAGSPGISTSNGEAWGAA